MQLNNLVNKYSSDDAALEQLRVELQAAQETLNQLEASTTGDIDKAASQAADTNRAIEMADFKVKAITKRQQNLRSEILKALKYEIAAHKDAKRDASQKRRALFDEIIGSDDWKATQKTMHALCYLYGGYWDSVCKHILPYEPTNSEQLESATELELAINDPEEPDAIEHAKHIIDFDDRFDESLTSTFH